MGSEYYRVLLQWMPLYMVVTLVQAAGGVFLGLCIYNDARLRRDPNPKMWAVLSGFLPVVGLIYVIVRNITHYQVPAFCIRCGTSLAGGYLVCPRCGMPAEAPSSWPAEQEARLRKRRRLYLILFIVLYAIAVTGAVLVQFQMMTQLMGHPPFSTFFEK